MLFDIKSVSLAQPGGAIKYTFFSVDGLPTPAQ